jgi:hypothetical protein
VTGRTNYRTQSYYIRLRSCYSELVMKTQSTEPKTKRSPEQLMRAAIVAVFEHWLNDGDGMTIAEIAAAIGCSPSTLRKHADVNYGCPRECAITTVSRTRKSKNYIGADIGSQQVAAWRPSEEFIRNEIKRLRTFVPASAQKVG